MITDITSGMFSSIILITASMFVFLFKITSMFWETRSVIEKKEWTR